ncbi:MAG: YbaK/EbsC family protein [bacterium]
MTVFDAIIKLLDESQTPYTLSVHKPVRTSEEASKIRGVEMKTGAKAMVIKANGFYHLLVLPADRKINWKKVKQLLNGKDATMATEQEAETVTHVQMGAVPPFGNILNLPTYFDDQILENEISNFNVGLRTHSVSMKTADLVRLVHPTISSISKD